MPIFALRAVRRMLDDLAPFLCPRRVRELEMKVHSRGEQTVPAEWEIAVGFALSKVGKVIDPGEGRPGNPDFIFVPTGTSNELVIEVTSLSDQRADLDNPVDDFTTRLGHIAVKEV